MMWAAPEVTRGPVPRTGDEPTMLAAFLDFHRLTLRHKCAGLTAEQLAARTAQPSIVSLLGLVRHMAEVERNWFTRGLLSKADAPFIWHKPGGVDDELVPLDDADWAADLAAWQAECDQSQAAAEDKDLGYEGTFEGKLLSLRWIYLHMIEEYARHNGHADLIRELLDGAVGR